MHSITIHVIFVLINLDPRPGAEIKIFNSYSPVVI